MQNCEIILARNIPANLFFLINNNKDYTKLENGDYRHVIGSVIKGPVDIGHTYGWEHRRLSLAAKEVGLTQSQFNDYVNAYPEKFRLENRSKNRGHYDEMPGKGDIERIKKDMQNFLNGR
ncbi:GH-E family nuclease [Avibacterium avium]|uniref:GH-E family nuclease n=1 Tax=Avibacterium avium TaxID=751 RepID=UPI003BF8E0C7